MYEDLQLRSGGGIIPASSLAPQQGDACIMIGIGGTGVDTLRKVKRAVYTHLQYDHYDPNSENEPAMPVYAGIQFLAIDTDSDALKKSITNARDLQPNELFSIQDPNLGAALANPELIRQNRNLDWMSLEGIQMLNTKGAGGIRQVGRYCLMKKANDLKTKLQGMITSAMAATGQPSVNIHIFAGISGGTGSGCFLDTCYIARAALGQTTGHLFGYFFLPDVMLNRQGIQGQKANEDSNKANGYAAFRELDYLMSLKASHERFQQNYGDFAVDTDDPPVDLCHLISGTNAKGQIIPDAYDYGQEVIAEYVLSYLTKVDGAIAGDQTGLTSAGHVANIAHHIDMIHPQYGAQRYYNILGASSAELPLTHIGTYLAAKTYEKLAPNLSRNSSDETCRSFADHMRLSRDGLRDLLSENLSRAPVYNWDILGKDLPDSLEDGENWNDVPKGTIHQAIVECDTAAAGKIEENYKAQIEELTSYDLDKIRAQTKPTFAAKLFIALSTAIRNPKHGTTVAAELLHSENCHDLRNVLDGIEKQTRDKKANEELNRDNFINAIKSAAHDYNHSMFGKKRRLEEYLDAWDSYLANEIDIRIDEKLITMISDFRNIVSKLYSEYFNPLREMVRELKDTFTDNLDYLEHLRNNPQADSSYCWRVFELEAVKDLLDESILARQDRAIEQNEFVDYLATHFSEWHERSSYRIGRCINAYMKQHFDAVLKRTIDNFLGDIYHTQDPGTLAANVQTQILQKVIEKSAPLFQRSKNFDFDSANTFVHSVLSVPNTSTAMTSAADEEKKGHKEMLVRKVQGGDRITCLNFVSGVPLFAYQGVYDLKQTYEATTSKGLHLHERDVDWKAALPTPIPFRLMPGETPNGKELAELYELAAKKEIICPKSPVNDDEYVVRLLPDTTELVANYDRANFFHGGHLLEGDLDAAIKALQEARRALLPSPVPEGHYLLLKNDGKAPIANDPQSIDYREPVRRDYFIRFGGLQGAARSSLEHLERVDAKLAEMTEWMEAPAREKKLVERYLFLLLNGQITESGRFNIDLTYTYKGIKETAVLCDFNKAFRQFPHYQAYVTLNAFNPDVLRTLEEIVDQLKKSLRGLDQAKIHALAGRYTDADEIRRIRDEAARLAICDDVVLFYQRLGDIAKELDNSPAAPVASAAPAAPNTWDCPTCGHKGNDGGFCEECGAPKPAAQPDTWDCPNCGRKGNKGKFCPGCGTKRVLPQDNGPWFCPECGTKITDGDFCENCGTKRP